MPAAKFEIIRNCKVCGTPFQAKTIDSWYCCTKCSKVAWKRRKDEEIRMQKLDTIVKKIPKSKELISVPEAYTLFGISKETIYRLVRKGVITSTNLGNTNDAHYIGERAAHAANIINERRGWV